LVIKKVFECITLQEGSKGKTRNFWVYGHELQPTYYDQNYECWVLKRAADYQTIVPLGWGDFEVNFLRNSGFRKITKLCSVAKIGNSEYVYNSWVRTELQRQSVNPSSPSSENESSSQE